MASLWDHRFGVAAKDGKFGTFGGVFTPSILTILGVIMYLRLPWVVGQAGLWMTLAVIGVAHVVSIATGLSISSIATDKSVGAGGPYYIVSRSLGLPIGGTLGIALFLGLSFSISLYVIGFCESFLAYRSIPLTETNIRIAGTIVIVALTTITLISTAVAIKTQYLIMGAIGLSLVVIAFAAPEHTPAAPLTTPHQGPNAEGFGAVFAIFFPAVTGFTAGVNMSGDLRDPKKSIPQGTMAAIALGLLVYVALAIFLAVTFTRDDLLPTDPVTGELVNRQLFVDVARFPAVVLAGIWGATLSSALGSIMGAPRILQALGADRIMPKFFARGYGKTNEPRNALIPAFVIGEAGILIAKLDSIAAVVSMVFLTTYGFLNLSAWIESWASPDFRPDFKIPRWVSLIGAVTCLLLMVQLDLVAMAGATVGMAAVFFLLQRRQLKLESGDTWEGIWSSVVRTGLQNLSTEKGAQRNWRPNILMFSAREAKNTIPLRRFAHTMVSGSGMVTEFHLNPKRGKSDAAKLDDQEDIGSEVTVGVFRRDLVIDEADRLDTIRNVTRFHGFSGIDPNTVLLDWYDQTKHAEGFAGLLRDVGDLDFNLILLAYDPQVGVRTRSRVDVWWRPGAGNFPLNVALIRFITAARNWSQAHIHFLVVSEDASQNDALRTAARRVLQDMRVEATVRIVSDDAPGRTYQDWIQDESADADLVVVGLPNEGKHIDSKWLGRTNKLVDTLGTVLLLRGSSAFKEVLPARRTTASFPTLQAPGLAELELDPVELPDTPELAVAASTMGRALGQLLADYHKQCVARVHGQGVELLQKIRNTIDKHYKLLEKGMVGANLRKQKNTVNRVQSSFLHEARGLLDDALSADLPDQVATITGRIETILNDVTVVAEGHDAELVVTRTPSDFKARPGDSSQVRRFKRQRRFRARLRSHVPNYVVKVGGLQRFYYELALRDILLPSVEALSTHGHQLMVQIGKLLNTSKTSLTLIGEGITGDVDLADYLEQQRIDALAVVDELLSREEQRVHLQKRDLLTASRDLSQGFADDIDRMDIVRLIARHRRPPRDASQTRAMLRDRPKTWAENQAHLIKRARLGLSISGFQHRLASISHRTKDNISLKIRNGVISDYEEFVARLEDYKDALASIAERSRAHTAELRDAEERRADSAPDALDLALATNPPPPSLFAAPSATAPAPLLSPVQPPADVAVADGHPEGESSGAELPKLKFAVDFKNRFESREVLDNLVAETASLGEDLPEEAETLTDASISRLAEGASEVEVVSLAVRRLVQFLLESEFIAGLQEAVSDVPTTEEHAIGVAQDVGRLLTFQIAELESTETDEDSGLDAGAFATQIAPVLENSLHRLRIELEKLRAIEPRVREALALKLLTVISATDPYELTSSSEQLQQHIRLHQGKLAVTGAGSYVRQWAEAVRSTIVDLLYRRSAGQLLARKLRTRRSGLVVDHVLQFVGQHSPKPEVLSTLPFYYRQLFFGQSTFDESFWHDREEQLERARRIVSDWRRGSAGAILVTGDPGAGKSALTQRIVHKHLDRSLLIRVEAPYAGTASLEVFEKSLRAAAKSQGAGTADELLSTLPEQTVVQIDDLELWWERSDHGLAVIDRIIGLVSRHGDRILFILGISTPALGFLNRLRPLSDQAIAVIECDPMPARDLEAIVMLRHGSTGVKFEYRGKGEDEISQWRRARLFTGHFDYCGGNVGAALCSWVTHVDKCTEDEQLVVRAPDASSWEQLDELKVEWVALLIELFLHKRADVDRLERITGLARDELERELVAMFRMRLVTRGRRGVIEINRFIQHMLIERFTQRGLL